MSMKKNKYVNYKMKWIKFKEVIFIVWFKNYVIFLKINLYSKSYYMVKVIRERIW